jgi:peptidoglycan hydrolase FlgJ
LDDHIAVIASEAIQGARAVALDRHVASLLAMTDSAKVRNALVRPSLSTTALPMAFNPRTDVIMEVLNAADPSRASLAAQRLSALAASNPTGADFSADLERAASPAAPTPLANAADARARLAEMPGGPDKLGEAKTQFEAMMLNSFVGELLPKDASNVFGQGTAGDMWRSMLAEQVSLQIAKSGKLGLARRLFATHEIALRGRSTQPGEAAKAASDAAQMSANILSAPAGAELGAGAVLFAGRKRT